MEPSILKSVKKTLGIAEGDQAYDLTILTFINSAFAILRQLGVGPSAGVVVVDDSVEWTSLNLPDDQLGMVQTYMYLKVRSLFDPPPTSFAIEAMNEQIKEHEWRLNVSREEILHPLEEV